ncbi:MAG: GNAT family N-acetyltransferase [Candidatus Nanopelagicales bacterium]
MQRLATMRTAQLPSEWLDSVRALCDAVFDTFTDDDWQHALGGWHAVLLDGDSALAHAAVVPRTLYVAEQPYAVGYVEAVATAAAHQGQGLGSRVMIEINALVREHFEIGGLATGAHPFYERLGWERWQGPTYARDGDVTRRTEDDDDSVMVLRCGPSADADLTAALTCETRPGDVW